MKQSICSSTIEGTKTNQSIRSTTNEGAKTKRSIRSSTIDVLPLLLLTHLSPASVFLSPQAGGGGGHTCIQVWGWGSPNSEDLRKSLILCLFSAPPLLYATGVSSPVQRRGATHSAGGEGVGGGGGGVKISEDPKQWIGQLH